MNTANYTQQDTYPVTTDGLAFIQNQSLVLEQMAAMLGTGNWILSGMDEDSDGNLTPGIVAIVADNSAKVMNYGGGDPAEGLSTAHFSISETTPTSPFYRTSQNLILDPEGDITGLDRVDIAELAQQIRDNATAIATANTNIATLAPRVSALEGKTVRTVKIEEFSDAFVELYDRVDSIVDFKLFLKQTYVGSILEIDHIEIDGAAVRLYSISTSGFLPVGYASRSGRGNDTVFGVYRYISQ